MPKPYFWMWLKAIIRRPSLLYVRYPCCKCKKKLWAWQEQLIGPWTYCNPCWDEVLELSKTAALVARTIARLTDEKKSALFMLVSRAAFLQTVEAVEEQLKTYKSTTYGHASSTLCYRTWVLNNGSVLTVKFFDLSQEQRSKGTYYIMESPSLKTKEDHWHLKTKTP